MLALLLEAYPLPFLIVNVAALVRMILAHSGPCASLGAACLRGMGQDDFGHAIALRVLLLSVMHGLPLDT